jgi:hypothetical protein
MSATSFGVGAFGIPSAETGLILHNISYTEKQDRKELKNHTGEVVGVTFLNETVEVKLDATLPTTSASLERWQAHLLWPTPSRTT